jgi:glycerol-3-phosphate responsive antiterminator
MNTTKITNMKTENIQRLIKIVQHLNPNCCEIGPGMMAQMQELAEEAKKEISAISHSLV